eukprot:7526274-Alexandrium_andersonii.AAC.1
MRAGFGASVQSRSGRPVHTTQRSEAVRIIVFCAPSGASTSMQHQCTHQCPHMHARTRASQAVWRLCDRSGFIPRLRG